MNKIKKIGFGIAGLLAIVLSLFLFSAFSDSNMLLASIFLLATIAIVGIAAYLLIKPRLESKAVTQVNSHTMVESLKRVFKVVTAEGHFTEIVDFKHTSQKIAIIPSTKKALIIVKAKVLMGYDFAQMEWEGSDENKMLRLKKIPQPHIISISPEITYYNMENGLFNKFNNEDLNKIQADCILQITENALKSDLPKLAAQQAKLLLTEMSAMHNWKLEGVQLLVNS